MGRKSDESRNARTAQRKRLFLVQLVEHRGTITHACEAAGIGRRTAYDWREADAEFAAAWDAEVEKVTDELEESAMARAIRGFSKKILKDDDGNVVGEELIPETALAIFMLKCRRSKIYRDKIEMEVTDHRPVMRRSEIETEDRWQQANGTPKNGSPSNN